MVTAETEQEILPESVRVALADEPTQHREVLPGSTDGVVSWLSWGSADAPLLIFVHGGAAHAWWWSWVAPLFSGRYHVVAVDLFGHGDSDRRDRYSFGGWVDQVLALADHLSAGVVPPVPPILVGHSMGGLVTALAAGTGRLRAAVIVDSPLGAPANVTVGEADATLARPKRYPTREFAVSRFRPLPDQPGNSARLIRFVAERSVTPLEDGWGWKFDVRMFSEAPVDRPDDLTVTLRSALCPIGIVIGGDSAVVGPADRHGLAELAAGSSIRLTEIPGGGHHLMFDRPTDLYRAIAGILDSWTESERQLMGQGAMHDTGDDPGR